MLAGTESEEELEAPSAMLLWELGWLADRFPELVPLLRAGHESGKWIRNGDAAEFTPSGG